MGKALDVRRHNVDIVSATIQEGWGNISELEAHKIDLDQVLKCLKKEYEDAQATEQVIHVSRICTLNNLAHSVGVLLELLIMKQA